MAEGQRPARRVIPGPQSKPKAQPSQTLRQKEDDLVFETFYHRTGKELQCIYQSGMRFYLNKSGPDEEWQPFPKRWYNEGLLVTNTIQKDDGGKKHNVHMYYDEDSGAWVRMPIDWELHHPMAKNLVDQVEEAVPSWKDRRDMLALLRACNYDPDECITIYQHLERDEWMAGSVISAHGKDKDEKRNDSKETELEKRVHDLAICSSDTSSDRLAGSNEGLPRSKVKSDQVDAAVRTPVSQVLPLLNPGKEDMTTEDFRGSIDQSSDFQEDEDLKNHPFRKVKLAGDSAGDETDDSPFHIPPGASTESQTKVTMTAKGIVYRKETVVTLPSGQRFKRTTTVEPL